MTVKKVPAKKVAVKKVVKTPEFAPEQPVVKRPPGRPRLNPLVPKPVARSNERKEPSFSRKMTMAAEQFALAQTQKIDLAADPAFRPLTGMDVDRFRARHRLTVQDIVHMLALQSSSQYNAVVRGERTPVPLKYIREFIVRICDKYPTAPPWMYFTMREAFERLYGQTLKQFEGTAFAGAARVMLYARFTALLGRSSFSAYRWIDKEGRGKPELVQALSKILERDNPRQAGEDVARTVWMVRGIDFEKVFPMPTVENLSTGQKKGRSPDARISKTIRMHAGSAV